jgi:hypothetical protein
VTGWDIVQSLVYLGEATAVAGDSCEARRIFLEALRLAMEAQIPPLALDALLGLAHLEAEAGNAEQALALSRCVSTHPASTHEAKERAQSLSALLGSQLPPHRVEAVQAQARARSFDATVAELLLSASNRQPHT